MAARLHCLISYPLIIANDSSLEKKEPPGNMVTVSLPACAHMCMHDS